MLADPGTVYSYGINTDWLGKVVEAVGGVGLDVAVKDGITGPLGMHETEFRIGEGWKDGGLTPVQAKVDGSWVDSGIELNQSPQYWAGGHGLYSTPNDYIKFEQALLGNGELDGVRILRSETVDAAFTNQIGDLDFPAEIPSADPGATHELNLGAGYKWGYGLLLNTEDVPGRAPRGQRCVGRAVQHPLLGGPHRGHLRVDLLQLPPVRPTRGAGPLRRLRAGALFRSVGRDGGSPCRHVRLLA